MEAGIDPPAAIVSQRVPVRHRGLMVATVLSACLSAICAAFGAVGCGDGKAGPSRQTGRVAERLPNEQVESVVPADLLPHHLIIVVRDVEGFYTDCGCSGQLIGGLHKVATVAAEYGVPRTFVFVGRTFSFPPSANSSPADAELAAAQSRSLVPSAVRYFQHIGGAVVALSRPESEFEALVPDPAIEVLQPAESQDFIAGGVNFKLRGYRLFLSGDESRPLVDAANLASRGRQLAVIPVWQARDGSSVSAVGRGLGAALKLARNSEAAAEALRKELSGRTSGTLVSSFTVQVDKSQADDPVALAIFEGDKVIVSSHEQGRGKLPVSFDTGAVVKEWRESCGTCHQAALDAWSKTLHSHAYHTLLGLGRQRDMRCVTCHTTERHSTESGVRIPVNMAAVTCNSCHTSDGRSPTQACATCHTPVSDPKGVWRPRVRDICPGGTSAPPGRSLNQAEASGHSCERSR